MIKVVYGGDTFGPFVTEEDAKAFVLETGGTPEFWVDKTAVVGLQYHNGQWEVGSEPTGS